MQLSIIHTTYNRAGHLERILPRFELNAKRHPDIDFEVVILDGGSSDNTAEVAKQFMKRETVKVKYVHVGFGKWTNPSLPRNIALRHAEGRIGCTTDADHWIGQDFIRGAYRAFEDGSDDKVSIGMVWDTNESRGVPWPKINNAILSSKLDDNLDILEFYRQVGIPIREPKSGWIVAYPMWAVEENHGYCEDFAGSDWGRDEDIFLLMLQERLQTTTEHHKEFAAIHLCHSVSEFGIRRNASKNHEIFKRKIDDLHAAISDNVMRDWGKVPEGVNYEVRQNF